MAGIYIHIPFCKQACHYCDFHFSTNLDIRSEMTQAIAEELTLQQDYLKGETINTIYFGGGTPSLLDAREFATIINTIRSQHTIASSPEITVEANPDDLNTGKLQMLKDLGVNRLSIGIQSFEDQILKYINRAHDSTMALNAIGNARAVGFDNISIDLIYAIPGQPIEAWKNNIRQAIALNPEHISSYSLTIEEQTAFGNWLRKGKISPLDDEQTALQLEMLVSELKPAGYEQYEVSNFSRPGFISRHNSSYWRQEKYLGVGPSAHSYNGTSRQFNISNNHLYLKAIKGGKIPCEIEVLTTEDHVNEYLLTTLRTMWGCDLTKLKYHYHYDLMNTHQDYLQQLISRQLAVIENDHFKLTAPGKLLADKISSDLFLQARNSSGPLS